MAIEIVDFPIKNGDFPWQNVSSPEGSSIIVTRGHFFNGEVSEGHGSSPLRAGTSDSWHIGLVSQLDPHSEGPMGFKMLI